MEAVLPENEAQRLDALRRYKVLDSPPEPAFDRIAEMAAKFFVCRWPASISSIRIASGSNHGWASMRNRQLAMRGYVARRCSHKGFTTRVTLLKTSVQSAIRSSQTWESVSMPLLHCGRKTA